MRKGQPVNLAQGVIAEGDEAIHWIKGQGLYAEVVLATEPYDGTPCKAAVGGSLFYATKRGRVHSEPIASGDHVIVALIDGDPNGHCVILSRVPGTHAEPGEQVAYRGVNEINLSNHYFDKHEKGGSHLIEYEDGSVFTRMVGSGNWTLKLPDGSVIDAQGNPLTNSYDLKLKQSQGAAVILSAKGVQVKSPSATSWIQVDDTGVTIAGPRVVTQGITLLSMSKEAADTPATQGVAFGTPGTVGPSGHSTRVYVGK